MKRFILLLLPVCLALASCKSGPEKINADLASIRAHAERGDADAQNELGVTYMKLWNSTEANKWFQKAAEQGMADAQYHLGENYEKGDGEPKNFIEAYAWFSVAAATGHLMAINGRERLSHLMSRSDIEEANRKAFAYATKMPSKKQNSETNAAPASTESLKPDSGKKPNLPAPKSE